MRLLHARTFKLKEFVGGDVPPYAILSHTWEEEEVLHQDILNLDEARRQKGFWKIERCCAKALDDGWEWVWIDTCCIDKTSSAELSEAINSMFQWYKHAMVCYAYLSDIDSQATLLARLGEMRAYRETSPPAVRVPCRWFYRSWTLQELIAPKIVQFFGVAWSYLGSKWELKSQIGSATGVHADVLSDARYLPRVTAGEKMSWAAYRQSTRVEDLSYSLLGIFDVNMPLLYGEGEKAFYRLQEHILKATEDHTLLLAKVDLLRHDNPSDLGSTKYWRIARSPDAFGVRFPAHYVPVDYWTQPSFVTTWGFGEPSLRIHLPTTELFPDDLLVLNITIPARNLGTLFLAALWVWPYAGTAESAGVYSSNSHTFIHRGVLARAAMILNRVGGRYSAYSKCILVSEHEAREWSVRPLCIDPPHSLDDAEQSELFTVESSHSLSPAASESGYRIIDSESSERTCTLGHSERYWILIGPENPVVAYFKYVRSDNEFICHIEEVGSETTPHDLLYKWRWWSEDQEFERCLPGTGPLWEKRFPINHRFHAVFFIARPKEPSSASIRVYFLIQNALPDPCGTVQPS